MLYLRSIPIVSIFEEFAISIFKDNRTFQSFFTIVWCITAVLTWVVYAFLHLVSVTTNLTLRVYKHPLPIVPFK